MKEILITILRDRNVSRDQYRQAADRLATVLAVESGAKLPTASIPVDTPLAHTAGVRFAKDVVLVPILRSGLVFLPAFVAFYPQAAIGFLGMRRDEETAIAKPYYCKLPPFSRDNTVFLLDPMIATGGSATLAVQTLLAAGAKESQITLVSFIAAPEGIAYFREQCPGVDLIVAHVDEGLDAHKFIMPGLGDFGDRYFATLG